jgi:hypothetical protein
VLLKNSSMMKLRSMKHKKGEVSPSLRIFSGPDPEKDGSATPSAGDSPATPPLSVKTASRFYSPGGFPQTPAKLCLFFFLMPFVTPRATPALRTGTGRAKPPARAFYFFTHSLSFLSRGDLSPQTPLLISFRPCGVSLGERLCEPPGATPLRGETRWFFWRYHHDRESERNP